MSHLYLRRDSWRHNFNSILCYAFFRSQKLTYCCWFEQTRDKSGYMIHQLIRHLITLRFEYPTYAYDVNSDVNGKKTCAPNCSIRQTRNNSIVYDIPNRPDSSILHKACTYDAIRHHNINKHNAELRGTAPGANIPKSMFLWAKIGLLAHYPKSMFLWAKIGLLAH